MLVLPRDEKKRYSAAFGKLNAERQIVVRALNGYFDERDELNQRFMRRLLQSGKCVFEVTAQGERRVTSSWAACHPRVFFLWLSVFVPVCWSKSRRPNIGDF